MVRLCVAFKKRGELMVCCMVLFARLQQVQIFGEVKLGASATAVWSSFIPSRQCFPALWQEHDIHFCVSPLRIAD